MRAADVIQIYQSMSALAGELGAVNLAQGVPEPVHDADWRSAIAAELPGAHFQYTQTRGIPALREAVASLYGRDAEGVFVTSGCTESLAAALLGLADLGRDAVVWLEPFYSYYPGLARIAGMEPYTVPVDLSGRTARLDPERLRDVLAPLGERAVLLLNTPHNPSGLTLDEESWREVAGLVETTGCFLLLDDSYRDFRYGAAPAPYARLLDTGRAAVAGAASKSFAATGVRIGWLLSPKELDPYAESAHMHLSNCAPDHVQRAAARILSTVTRDRLDRTAARYREKRDTLLAALAAAGLDAVVPEGGHFVLTRHPRDGRTGTDLALELAHSAGVVPLPLDTFYTTAPERPRLRFSFAVSADDLDLACRRLAGRERIR